MHPHGSAAATAAAWNAMCGPNAGIVCAFEKEEYQDIATCCSTGDDYTQPTGTHATANCDTGPEGHQLNFNSTPR